MKILVIYHITEFKIRNTIKDHLFSFRNFSNEHCFYVNVAYGVPKKILKIDFDLVIYHYTFTTLKTLGKKRFLKFLNKISILKNIGGFKIALPQDEYHFVEEISIFYKNFNVDMIFSVFTKRNLIDFEKLFPYEKTGIKFYESVLTGYASEAPKTIDLTTFSIKNKTIDLGYRARKLPYVYGNTGFNKWKISEAFLKYSNYKNLKLDISNQRKDELLGSNWTIFLKKCRCVLGTEGGVSVYDEIGDIEKKINAHLIINPKAKFHEIEKKFLLDDEAIMNYSMITPRVFEAVEAGACLVLLNGEYNGILKADYHYISVNKNFDNIDTVIEKIRDIDYCKKIAQNAYRDLIYSGNYSYSNFVKFVLTSALKNFNLNSETINFEELQTLKMLKLIYKTPLLFYPHKYLKYLFVNILVFIKKRITFS